MKTNLTLNREGMIYSNNITKGLYEVIEDSVNFVVLKPYMSDGLKGIREVPNHKFLAQYLRVHTL